MTKPLVAIALLGLGCAHAGLGPETLVSKVARGDDEAADALRAQGQAGLDAVITALASTTDATERARLIAGAARIAKQRDAHVSGLFWFEDLDEALRVAQAQHKPLLSLRMLGRLDEELSCANSRFFRTTLYANAEVAKLLRSDFVLHWSSERPVPVVNIDFGDGRKVTRTLTGNSIHYVLDVHGRVIDALPGLYGAEAFKEALLAAKKQAVAVERLADEEFAMNNAGWHEQQLRVALMSYRADRKAAGLAGAVSTLPSIPGLSARNPWPSSRAAVPMAMPKAMVEAPIIDRIVPDDGGAALPSDPTPWGALAAVRKKQSALDARSRALVLAKSPVDVSTRAAPALSAAQLEKLLAKLEESIAMDTARNEYALHAIIRRWLAENPKVAMAALNREVYARLFLTPASDPWLGLVPELTWTGLPHDGIEVTQR